MNGMAVILVAFGAGCGATARYLVSLWFQRRIKSVFPWSTWLINMIGTFALGLSLELVPAASQQTGFWLWFGPGLCGGFTTFSTMVQETTDLLRKHKMLGIVYICTSLGIGLLLASILQIAFVA